MRSRERLLVLAAFETTAVLCLLGAILFGAAGTFRAPMFWLYLAVSAVLYFFALGLVYRKSPDLMEERLRPGAGEQDRVSIAAMFVLLLIHYAVAGLDVGHFHGACRVPPGLQAAGLVAYVAGYLLVLRAMLVNRFFSSAVRIQPDRGQTLVTSGPYRFVRHPGYAGGLLFLLSSGVALGSWLSVLPMLLVVPVIVRRIVIEERMLRDKLPGYTGYMQAVRFRLIPGLW